MSEYCGMCNRERHCPKCGSSWFVNTYSTNYNSAKNAFMYIRSTDNTTRVNRVIAGLEKRRNGNHVFGIPGGQVNFGESQFAGACRELREETGLIFNPAWKFIGAIVTDEGITYIYDATGYRISPVVNDHELIAAVRMRESEFINAFANKNYIMSCDGHSGRMRDSTRNNILAFKDEFLH